MRTRAPLARIPGPSRKGGPGHQGNLRALQAAASDLVNRWGKERLAGNDSRRKLLARDLAIFHEEWQLLAREEVFFLSGWQWSGEVGKAIQVEQVHLASLVVGGDSGRPKFFRCCATRWCVRRLQEAANGWQPTGGKWWDNWVERLDTWVKDDLLRPSLKKEFESVWRQWKHRE